MLTSYHVHTNRSDGEAPASDVVEAAIKLGLDELGISDHYVLLPGGKSSSWSMPLTDLPAYFAELDELREEVRGKLVIRSGVEADFDPGTYAELRDILAEHPFDYVIGSMHYVDGFPIDMNREPWDALSEAERNQIVVAYLDRMAQLAKSGVFDFVGHFDLYKKFGFLPTVDVSEQLATALDAIAAAGIPMEINTSGWYKDIKECYPSEHILREARRRSIPILITADAHYPEDLTRDFDKARLLASKVGYDSVAAFEKRRMSVVAI